MKKIITFIAAAMFATATFAADTTKKVEEVKKPASAASAPATPKAMPKVEKPAKKEVKKDAKKEEKK